MSSQVYCNCNRPNTRQTAFARANGFDCPDCNRKLNPDPNAESYQDDDNAQDSPSSPTPNFLPPSPLSQYSSFPIPPDNYPHTLAELRDVPIFNTPDPPEIRQSTGEDEEPAQRSRGQRQHTPPVPVRSTSDPTATREDNQQDFDFVEDQDNVPTFSPIRNQTPSPYLARTPQRIIEVDPYEAFSDDEGSWDDQDIQPRHHSRTASNASHHTYQSLRSINDPQEETHQHATEEDPQTPEPHYLAPVGRQEAADNLEDSRRNPNFQKELTDLQDELHRRRRTKGTATDPVIISTPQTEEGFIAAMSTPRKTEMDRIARFKETFSGKDGQNIEAFFDRYDLWCAKNGHDKEYKTQHFFLLLDDPAYGAYRSLDQSVKSDYDLMKRDMITFYTPTKLPIDEQFEQLTELNMKKGDKVQTYFNTVMKKAEHLGMPESQKTVIFKRGLPKYIKRYI